MKAIETLLSCIVNAAMAADYIAEHATSKSVAQDFASVARRLWKIVDEIKWILKEEKDGA